MDEVIELLKTWELEELIPLFTEHQITIQALAALTHEDLKDLIPRAGPRVLFTRCWRTWKNEFSPDIDPKNASTFSGLDISNIEIEKYIHSSTENDAADLIFIPLNHEKNEKDPTKSSGEEIELPTNIETVATRTLNVLEDLLKQSLETSSLLLYKGGSLDGDTTRNLLASIIAKEILNENKNAPIVGQIYFKWTKFIKELFPGERTTTYYIPACTTASGAIYQARGKLVHQVLNKRRRFQQLGSLTAKKRNREESPQPSSSPRPLPNFIDTSNVIPIESVQEDLMWLRNSSEPWKFVVSKWKTTVKQRLLNLHTDVPSIESYFDTYPSLRKPLGYTLLHLDFEEVYKDHVDNLFIYFPVVKIKLLDLLIKRKSKKVDTFYQELVHLAEYLTPPNPKCYVCAPKPEVGLACNLKQLTLKDLTTAFKEGLNMQAPDATVEGKGLVVLSSEPGETDHNNEKTLEEIGLNDGCALLVDDFLQNYEVRVRLQQENEEKSWRLITDADAPMPGPKEAEKSNGSNGSEPKPGPSKPKEDSDSDMEIIEEDDDEPTVA